MGRRSNYDLPPQCSVCWCDAYRVPAWIENYEVHQYHYGPFYCHFHWNHAPEVVCTECATERIGPNDWKIHDHTHPSYWWDPTLRDKGK